MFPDGEMFLWSYKIHDKVNKVLNKSSPSYKEAEQMYQKENMDNFWYIMYTFASNLDVYNQSYFKNFVQASMKMLSIDKYNLLKKYPNCIYPKNSQGMFLWIYTLNQAYNCITNTRNEESYKLKKDFFYSKCDKCDLH
jgi:hypothetical protein